MTTTKTIALIKQIHAPAHVVFEAISKGVLLDSTGVKATTLKHDFRVGGLYSLDWACLDGASCSGKYLEIVPNELVRFTWHSKGSESATTSDTVVTVTITEQNGKTQLKLVHEGLLRGFVHDDHLKGWQSSVDDFADRLAPAKVSG